MDLVIGVTSVVYRNNCDSKRLSRVSREDRDWDPRAQVIKVSVEEPSPAFSHSGLSQAQANMMNLDYEPARGKERELKAYKEVGRFNEWLFFQDPIFINSQKSYFACIFSFHGLKFHHWILNLEEESPSPMLEASL